MKFGRLTETELVNRLKPPENKVRMVLDTDTYNEVDDQFALAYALKSTEKISLEAVYAAPFDNHRSSGPEDGMEKSYQEILKILEKLKIDKSDFVFKGSTGFLQSLDKPGKSKAVEDLITKAMSADKKPLYVVAIGAITNVASAILLEPDIIKKIVVVWLGGHAHHWPHTDEFNLQQDILASQLIFDCGVPLVQIPCVGVADHLITTVPELKEYLKGKSPIGSYLTDIVSNYTNNPYGWSKVIWDISAVAYLVNSNWVPTTLVHSPILTDKKTWSFDQSRHLIRKAVEVNRDEIFADLFRKLT